MSQEILFDFCRFMMLGDDPSLFLTMRILFWFLK
jgi:hypothetical protein